ncbi:MAG: hypothetical protein R3C30_12370 [Hyphomonadaceae bacterium]
MNASPPSDTQIDRTAPLALWRVAEAFMRLLAALFGDPSHVAAKHTLTLKAHQLMASWLRTGEAMMRRLLLIEAAAYAKPNTRPLLRAPRKRTRKLMHFFPGTPEQWRVSFRCLAPMLRQAQHDAVGSAAGSVSVSLSLSKAKAPRPFIFREDRPRRATNRVQRRRAKRTRAKPILRQDREWLKHEPPRAFRSAWPLAERYEALRRAVANPRTYAARLARVLHATPHRVHELLRASPEAEQHLNALGALTAAAKTQAKIFNSG